VVHDRLDRVGCVVAVVHDHGDLDQVQMVVAAERRTRSQLRRREADPGSDSAPWFLPGTEETAGRVCWGVMPL